jgi:plasmid maintenance system antidote protein VapI
MISHPNIIYAIKKSLQQSKQRTAYLAKLAESKGVCTRMTVYNFLDGKNKIPFDTACKLARLVGLKVSVTKITTK